MRDITYNIELAKSGDKVLAVTGNGSGKQYLHSRIDPGKESLRFRKNLEKKQGLLIILGFGLGYHLDGNFDLLKTMQSVLVVDILPEMEEQTKVIQSLQQNGVNSILYSGFSSEELGKMIKREIDLSTSQSISVLEHGASFRIFNSYYAEIKKCILAVINNRITNSATINAFAGRFFINGIKNIVRGSTLKSFQNLVDNFKEYRAVVVSSSPGAAFVIDDIKKYQNSLFIIAVDSAVKMLQLHGITPDFLISVDPQALIDEHLVGCSLKDTIGISSLTSYPHAKRCKSSYIGLNTHPLSQLLNELFPGRFSTFESKTGNVAGDALMAACLMGFKSIYFCGVDLSFPAYSIYSTASSYQERYSLKFRNRFVTTESYNVSYIFSSSGRYKKERVYTRKSLSSYQDKFNTCFTDYKRRITVLSKTEYKPLNFEYIEALRSGEDIEKKKILEEIESTVPKLVLSKKKIVSLLRKDEFFNKLCDASHISDTRRTKLLTLINNL